MLMKYSNFIIIKMVWLLIIITNHQFIMAGDIDQIHGGPRCIDEEKKVLLELKAWLRSRWNGFNDDDSGIKSSFLPSWVDDQLDDGGNCCDGWERVICDSLTGHVLKLELSYIYKVYPFYHNKFNSTWSSTSNTGFAKLSKLKQLENLDINDNQLDASVLTSLTTIKSLRVLDISGNDYMFNDNSSSQGLKFEKLSALKQLEELYINDMNLYTRILPSLGTIKSLKVLHLEKNNMFIHNFSSQDCEALLGLRKLEELSLDYNTRFEIEVKINISCLGSLPSLRSLSLNGNVGVGGLDKLRQLEVLNMSACGLTTKDVKSLSKMMKLKSLDLSWNYINKDVLVELGVFPSLQFLNLAYNSYGLEGSILTNEDFIGFHHLETLNLAHCCLSGTIPTHSLCKMDKLKELDLRHNDFEGGIPSCLNELSFLKRLDFSYNQLGGNLSSSMFRDLNSLEYIDLRRNNNFQGTFSFSIFANFSKLEEVRISNSVLMETEELAEWVPKFQLKTLEMSNCSLNKIPKFLLFQKDLSILNLSHNRLGGSFPNWLLVNNTRLEYLILRGNHFNGSLSLPQTKSEISGLDISNNQFKGHIPTNIWQLLPLLRHINISFNAFDGAIPRSLGNMSSLWTLSMSNNNLVGEVPIEIMSSNSLGDLDLSSNNLSGFSSTFNLSTRSSLDVIDISHNKMSGHIPLFSTFVKVLLMRNNYFSGVFPCELFTGAILVDISYNSFTGALPDCSGLNNDLIHLNLHGNKFTGLVPETILNSSTLLTLDIGNNLFSGRIPNLIHDESPLQILLVRGNGLSGAIPDELCKLKMLNLLDLSHNSFSGSIPTCLGTNNISFGGWTNLRNSFEMGYSDGQSTVDILYTTDVVILSKHRIDSYTGKLLDLMSGLDLSSNNLEGEIPDALGNLSSILALNLSNNWLSGPIPDTFSNLIQIESLDLSHNNLSGEIPSNLANLHFMGTFSVAYNNLSGRLPEMKGQLGTFEGDSYAGNPFLCGPQLKKDCNVEVKDDDGDNDVHDHGKWYDIVYREGFFACFMGSYIVYILGFITVLWINPRWRNIWFNFIEKLLFSSYYFLSDTLYKCFRVRI